MKPMMNKLRISGVVDDSIVDGPGVRFTIFTQGCHHHCPGCHNPETHDVEGGYLADIEDLKKQISNNILLDGITLSGGDPMRQAAACVALAKWAHKQNFTVWCYTGYTWEQLLELQDPDQLALLKNIDVLVDGPFIKSRKSMECKFRGSTNQRLIDVQRSLKTDSLQLVA